MKRFFVVLCEDLQSYCFIRRALIEVGAEARNIFRHPYPDSRFNASGGGSPRIVDGYTVYACGSQHVRENYPSQLAAVRTRNARRDTALVVHLDVDNTTAAGPTVNDRHRELTDACAVARVPPRTSTDRVAWLVPRRELETWIHVLLGASPVDEHTKYPKLTGREADAEPASVMFAQRARAGTKPASAVPSLILGLAEFTRVI